MSRSFKIKGVSFSISNAVMGTNLTELPYKYDVEMLNDRGFWVRLCGCNTLAEGKEKAQAHMDGRVINYR